MGVLDRADFGSSISAAIIEAGLRELNPELKFDLAGTHGLWHPYLDTRQGVYYREQHVCSMDRGVVPEFKVWETKKKIVPIPWSEADREDASIRYEVLPVDTPGYEDLKILAETGSDPEYMLRGDAVLKCQAYGYEVASKRCVRVGWRHTFERILAFGVPGVTRQALADKFRVDMNLMAQGTHQELVAALVEE
jgi:hypothetical protein